MTRLLYIANARIPTEKAHGLQIMQNCEALADAGAGVTLWAARRINTPELRMVDDVWAHYGVKRNFDLKRVPCIDLQSPVTDRHFVLRRGAFFLQYVTYLIGLVVWLLNARADVYYTRDLPAALLALVMKPGGKVGYEPHRLSKSGMGGWLQRRVVRRASAVFPVTPHLAEAFIQQGADPARVRAAHDGIRRERFEHMPDQQAARDVIGLPTDAFIVGYIGRLHTMSMDKGVGTLIEALRQVDGASLALVGGPDEMAHRLREQWLADGLPAERFLYAGQVKPDAVPLYLSAFDVCAMPFPWTEHFAYYASPIKLFEYMASGRAIVASDLPSTAGVVQDGESALLAAPGDADALAAAILRLRDDPALRARLAANARELVLARYTWAARAKMILEYLTVRPPLQDGDGESSEVRRG